ncbi:MAG: hypothetical protein PHR35_00310 [Kiritimatiellae bacterium]|nr:hypothetical protein [Kiritimatiellia bacterium]
MKRCLRILGKVLLVFFSLSGLFWWALIAPTGIAIHAKHRTLAKWPPETPFFPIDGVVVQRVLLDKTDRDSFHGDGTILKAYQVEVTDSVFKILSNNRIRSSRIWLARPFDEKTSSALAFLSRWTEATQAAPFLKQLMVSKDLYITVDDLQRDSDAAMWLFSPSQRLLIFVQVNT